MFPTHVRAMVLDSAIDPDLTSEELIIGQADGFEGSLDAFFGWCAKTACPWRPTGDPTAAVLNLIAQMSQTSLPAGGGQSAGAGELYNALLGGLYAESDWPTLARALAQASAGNGAGVLAMSNAYTSFGSSNLVAANTAINCLDHPTWTQLSAYPQMAATAASDAPVFGPLLAWGLLGCAVWPYPPTRQPQATTAPGSGPIVVVGTTEDPATPYQWAEHLASELQHGELVTWNGMNHVAYFYSPCIRSVEAAALVGATLPPANTMCSD